MHNNQRGFVSLLTVTLMSILILLLTVGMARLMNGELHQATDSADSVKAYYTSQGVAENTAQQLRTYIEVGTTPPGQPPRTPNDLTSLNQSCGSSAVYTTPSVAVTSLNCVEVTTSTTQVNTDLGQNQTQTYDLSNSVLTEGGNLTRMVVSWDAANVSGGGSFTDPGDGAVGSTWNTTGATTGNQPPVIELGITNYFPGQYTNINQTYSGTVLLDPRPAGTSGAITTANYLCYLPNTVGPGGIGGISCSNGANTPTYQVNCTNGAPKRCTAEITNLVPPGATGDRTVVTITPLFHDAQLTLSAYATLPTVAGVTCNTDATTTAHNDCLAPIALQDATVDVTTTAGGSTRRVQLSVPVRSVQALNDVLQGDSDICKSFDILNVGPVYQVAQPNGSAKPSCPINDNLGAYDPEPAPSASLAMTAGGGTCTLSGRGGSVVWQGPVSVSGANPGDQLLIKAAVQPVGGSSSSQTVTADGSGYFSNANFQIRRGLRGGAILPPNPSWILTVTDTTTPSVSSASATATCS